MKRGDIIILILLLIAMALAGDYLLRHPEIADQDQQERGETR